MEKSDGDELFKDYFETFNSEADPACEDSDPLSGFGSDLNLDCLGPTDPDDLLNPITSFVEEELLAGPRGGDQPHVYEASDHHYDNELPAPAVHIHDLQQAPADHQYAVEDGLLETGARSLEPGARSLEPPQSLDTVIKQELTEPSHNPAPGPAIGLRIAGFAVDPDVCSVLEPSTHRYPGPDPDQAHHQGSGAFLNIPEPDQTQVVPQSLSRAQTTINHHLPESIRLATILFPSHKTQLRKVYQVNEQDREKEFVILTSTKYENSSDSDWKLFLPKYSPVLKRDFSQTFYVVANSDSRYTNQSISYKSNWKFQSTNNLFYADLIEDWEELKRRQNKTFIVCVNNFSMKSSLTKNIRHYFKEAPNIFFTVNLTYARDFVSLGYEFVQFIPPTQKRREFAKQIFEFMKNMPYQIHRHPNDGNLSRIWDAAVLFESDLYSQFIQEEEVERNIFLALNNYRERLEKSTGYLYLKRYPDIQYLVLTKPHVRINQLNTANQSTQSAPVATTSMYNTQSHSGHPPRPPRPAAQPRYVAVPVPRVPTNAAAARQLVTLKPGLVSGQPFSHSPSTVMQTAPQVPNQAVAGPSGIRQQVFRIQGPKTVGSLRPVNYFSAPVPVPPHQPQPGPSNQHVLDNMRDQFSSDTQQTPIIVSVSSMASSSSLTSVTPVSDKFVCPLPSLQCPDQREKDRDGLINHLTLGHYSNNITNIIASLQRKSNEKLSENECPFLNCGYYSHSTQDLIIHFGFVHNSSVQHLQRENINLKSLLDKGFQFLNPVNKELSTCQVCSRTVAKKHLVQHMALAHLKDQYLEEMKANPRWESSRATSRCPRCNYQYGIGPPITEIVAKTRDILLIKHYAEFHVHPSKKFGGQTSKVSAKPWRVPEQKDTSPAMLSVFGEIPSLSVNKVLKQLQGISSMDVCSMECKICKKPIAKMLNGNDSQIFTTLKNHNKQCWSQGKLTCRVCNTTVYVTKDKSSKSLKSIKEHLDLDEHKEKNKMYNLLKDVYCKARGFSVNDGFIVSNYKFFILALKAYAMHHEGMTVSNCLSMLMSILEISQKQYKDLYRHVDMLYKEPTPNYLCYCCNYAEYGRISGLSRHIQGPEHLQALARLSKDNLVVLNSSDEYLSCSKCGMFFNSDNIMDHADHIIEISKEVENEEEESDGEKQSPDQKKRKLVMNIVNEYDEDLVDISQEEPENIETGGIADSVDDPNFVPKEAEEVEKDEEQYVLDDDEFISSEKQEGELSSENGSSSSREPRDKADDSNCLISLAEKEDSDKDLSDEQYYYFCLDCEKESSSCYSSSNELLKNNPKFPLSMDIAKHMRTKNHQNFVPIRKRLSINVQNLSFNSAYHKTIIKRWKKLVRDEEISDVTYSQPRICRKCNIPMNDAIDMFKHIRDVHMKT